VPAASEIETDTDSSADDDLLAEFDIESFDETDSDEPARVEDPMDEDIDAASASETPSLDTEEVDFDAELTAGEDVDRVLQSISAGGFDDEAAADLDREVNAAVEEAVADTMADPVYTEPTPSEAVPPVTAPHEETPTMTAAAQRNDSLTDDQAATAAAGAMAKLMGRMDLGGEQTLEGLVREMLKPMLKEWLDANLPRIVEAKVEAEVQRIARMAG